MASFAINRNTDGNFASGIPATVLDPLKLEVARGGGHDARKAYVESFAAVPEINNALRKGVVATLQYDPSPEKLKNALRESNSDGVTTNLDSVVKEALELCESNAYLAGIAPGFTEPFLSPQHIVVFPRFFDITTFTALEDLLVLNPFDAVSVFLQGVDYAWGLSKGVKLGRRSISGKMDTSPGFDDWLLEIISLHAQLEKILDGALPVSERHLFYIMKKYLNYYNAGLEMESNLRGSKESKLFKMQIDSMKIKVREEWHQETQTFLYDAFMQAQNGGTLTANVIVDKFKSRIL